MIRSSRNSSRAAKRSFNGECCSLFQLSLSFFRFHFSAFLAFIWSRRHGNAYKAEQNKSKNRVRLSANRSGDAISVDMIDESRVACSTNLLFALFKAWSGNCLLADKATVRLEGSRVIHSAPCASIISILKLISLRHRGSSASVYDARMKMKPFPMPLSSRFITN